MATYDLVIVGGGVGGASLGKAMAGHGQRVLIIERELRFRDRVRGEFLFPWGVAEAMELGVYDALIEAGGHHPQYWTEHAGPDALPPRDLATDTPQGLRGLSIYHPQLQEALLGSAGAAGAEVWRGSRVAQVEPGREPRVLVDGPRGRTTVAARLVVGADGRSSMVRKGGGFSSRTDPPGNIFAGVLLENVPAPDASSVCMTNPSVLRMVLYFPQTPDRGRAYLAAPSEGGPRFRGDTDFGPFLEECQRSGLAPGLLDGARQAGPLATFEGADTWVDHPYRDGIALLGDAAATSDPSWGQGLSLTLRDARVLRDALAAHGDRDAAGHAYANTHDRHYGAVREATSLFSQVFLEAGPGADTIRARVLPQLEADPFVLPDTLFSGPDLAPVTGEHRAKIFGTDVPGRGAGHCGGHRGAGAGLGAVDRRRGPFSRCAGRRAP